MIVKMSPQPNKIDFKQLDEEDANVATALKLWKVADTGFPNGSPWLVDQFLYSLEAKNSMTFIASTSERDTETGKVEEKIIGVLIASNTGFEIDIFLIAVANSYKEKGIGKKLMQELIEIAKSKKLEAIFLEVRVSNQPAIHLYKSLNFEEITLRRNYYTNPSEDALIMGLSL